MTNEITSTPKNETHTWLEPGAWRKPCIVHVTMVANSLQALFGKLTHNGAEAVIEKTPIGWVLINQQRRMLDMCPEVRVLADKVMPDHHHMVLQVLRTMPRSIKQVVRGYMQGCKEDARKLGFSENLYDAPPFYRVLTHKGQLHAMIEYVKANPAGSRQGKVVLVQHTNFYDADYSGAYSIKEYTSVKSYDEFGNWQHEKIELKPLNKDFNPIIINAEEAEDFRVIGEFVDVVSDVLTL